ncbi:TPA: hypothetical protein DIV48_00135 [Candidatus Kaiserbacteria bacterium]|nr:MAG: hypothetical protein UY93_C0002G0191 [Parcubacteria group bacterium GW2011_GWA1_56_13]KKW46757.1 MAG: hypothetical protein UY97_C0003G0031 [Parcubacteria group bacterium GW2011_GWB1_57_6]HCR52041.1 hypothetical protein [Candidatus Kaiserbacteria bacterium]
MYEKSGRDRGAVIIVPIDEKTGRIVLVMEPSKPEPHYWKFPGGGIELCDVDPRFPDDDMQAAYNAARREAEEETGVAVEVAHIATIPRKTHIVHIFTGLGDVDQLRKRGPEGEIPQAFSLGQIRALTNFMPSHRPILDIAVEKLTR